MNESMDELTIEINSTVGDSVSNINKLITSLNKLDSSLKKVVNQSKNLSILKNNLSTSGVVSSGAKKTKTFKSERSQLADLGVDLSKYKLFSSIKETNSELLKYKDTLGNVVTITRKYTDNGLRRTGKELSNVKVRLSETHKELKNGNSLWNSLTKGVSGFIVKAKLIVGEIKNFANSLADMVENASKYEESLNLFKVTMGDYFGKADSFVKKFSDALYLDPANVMQYMGSFNSLVKGLGVGAENSYLMSQNLTQLVYDLASFKNLSFEESFRKLQSAISGELEPLRNVGVALSQNTLQELANSLGIKQRVAEMNEAQKAQLRYIQIMKSSTEWQTDMGRTLITPANTIRVMKEQVSLLAKAIGRVFIPIIMELMPYVMALTQMLTDLANTIANFLGYEIADVDYSGLGELGTLVGDIGDEAEKTTNKLNTMLAPFDELNVVQNKTKSASDGLGALGGDLGVDLPFYDALANLDKNFNDNLVKAKENLNEILKIVGLIGVGLLSWKLASWITSLSLPVGGTLFGGTIAGMTNGGLLLKQLKIFAGISLIATGVVGNLYGINTDDFWGSILGKLGGSASLAGGTWMLTKNITLTLGVTAISTTLGAIDAIKDLIDINPTMEEFESVPVIGPLVTFGRKIGKGAHDIFGNSFYDLGVFIGDSVTKGLGAVGKLFGLTKDESTTHVGSSGKTHGGAGKSFDSFIDRVTNKYSQFVKDMNNLQKENNDNMLNNLNTTGENITKSTEKFTQNSEKIITDNLNNTNGKINNFLNNTNTLTDNTYASQNISLNNALNNQNSIINNKLPSIINSWKTLGNDSKNSFTNGISGLGTDTQNKMTSELKSISSQKSWINNVMSTFASIGKTLGNSLSSNINIDSNTVANNIQRGLTGIKFVDTVLGVTKQLFQGVKVTGYATGGFPESGQFFMARENGIPEMVGRIGNKTAVANNEQITTAITNAVVQGLSGFNRGNTPVTVYIGNDKIYEGYGQHIDDENDRYGTNVVRV